MSKTNNESDAVALNSQNEILADLIKAYVDVRITETKLAFQLLERFLDLGKAFVDSEIKHKKHVRKQASKQAAESKSSSSLKQELEAERAKNKELNAKLSASSRIRVNPGVADPIKENQESDESSVRVKPFISSSRPKK